MMMVLLVDKQEMDANVILHFITAMSPALPFISHHLNDDDGGDDDENVTCLNETNSVGKSSKSKSYYADSTQKHIDYWHPAASSPPPQSLWP